jgi:hypothetical protein
MSNGLPKIERQKRTKCSGKTGRKTEGEHVRVGLFCRETDLGNACQKESKNGQRSVADKPAHLPIILVHAQNSQKQGRRPLAPSPAGHGTRTRGTLLPFPDHPIRLGPPKYLPTRILPQSSICSRYQTLIRMPPTPPCSSGAYGIPLQTLHIDKTAARCLLVAFLRLTSLFHDHRQGRTTS